MLPRKIAATGLAGSGALRKGAADAGALNDQRCAQRSMIASRV
jgi:hypothetical protein